jgi:hypothetical protein
VRRQNAGARSSLFYFPAEAMQGPYSNRRLSHDHTVKLGDARPVTPELRMEHEALVVCLSLFEYKKLSKPEAIEQIKTDLTIKGQYGSLRQVWDRECGVKYVSWSEKVDDFPH